MRDLLQELISCTYESIEITQHNFKLNFSYAIFIIK